MGIILRTLPKSLYGIHVLLVNQSRMLTIAHLDLADLLGKSSTMMIDTQRARLLGS